MMPEQDSRPPFMMGIPCSQPCSHLHTCMLMRTEDDSGICPCKPFYGVIGGVSSRIRVSYRIRAYRPSEGRFLLFCPACAGCRRNARKHDETCMQARTPRNRTEIADCCHPRTPICLSALRT